MSKFSKLQACRVYLKELRDEPVNVLFRSHCYSMLIYHL
jgi:hypothetical protein